MSDVSTEFVDLLTFLQSSSLGCDFETLISEFDGSRDTFITRVRMIDIQRVKQEVSRCIMMRQNDMTALEKKVKRDALGGMKRPTWLLAFVVYAIAAVVAAVIVFMIRGGLINLTWFTRSFIWLFDSSSPQAPS